VRPRRRRRRGRVVVDTVFERPRLPASREGVANDSKPKGRVRGHHRRDRAASPVAKYTKAFLIHPLSVENSHNQQLHHSWMGLSSSPSS
jgi:hypothetical protein